MPTSDHSLRALGGFSGACDPIRALERQVAAQAESHSRDGQAAAGTSGHKQHHQSTAESDRRIDTFFQIKTKHCIYPCRKSWLPYLSKATVGTRAMLLILISVCSIFVCPNNGMAASAFSVCAQGMYVHCKRVCTES